MGLGWDSSTTWCGYTVAYLVYTIGTIITGGTLHAKAALGGLIAVLAMISIVIALIVRSNKD